MNQDFRNTSPEKIFQTQPGHFITGMFQRSIARKSSTDSDILFYKNKETRVCMQKLAKKMRNP